MDGFGNSALTAEAHGDVLHAAAFSNANLADPGFPFNAFSDNRFTDDGFPYDDDLDAAYPASFPEDPFPEALFADVLFADATSSNAVSSRPGLQDRIAAALALLKADLNADNAGLIDQIHAYENFKHAGPPANRRGFR
jgi:hypothetical protein